MSNWENYGRYRLANADCLEAMSGIPANTVDLTVTSPPYDNLRTYNGTLEWGEHVWKPVLEHLFRVTKSGGVVVWIVNDATIKGSETGTSFRQALYAKEIGFNLHDTMIWVKDGGGAIGSQKCYTQNIEYMFVFSRDTPSTINLVRDKPNLSYGVDKSGVGRRDKDGNKKIEKRKPANEYSRRNNWWYVPPQKGEHPAVFPLSLAQDHIISWSNENDVVLDPFLGSGTTGVACMNLNRRFIGIEKDATYYELAKNRIAEFVPKKEKDANT